MVFMMSKLTPIARRMINRLRNIISHPASHPELIQTLLIFAVITVLAFETVSIFYKLVSFPLMAAPPEKSSDVRPENSNNGKRNQLQSYSVITERNLFLSTLKVSSEKQNDSGFFASGPEASAFELKGTIAGDTSFGFAILEERGVNKQILRRLGEMVGSARLIKITRNTAVLRSGDRDITMKIKETLDGSLFSRPAASGKGTSVSLSRGEVTEKLADLKTLMTHAAVRPAFVDGAQEGYIISDIKPDSLYQKLGLQDGDVILDVNSERMESADDIFQLLNLMQSDTNISLNLKRNGKMETINYSFQ